MGPGCCFNTPLLNEMKTHVWKATVFWFSDCFPQYLTRAPCFGSMWWHWDREFGVSSDSWFQQHWQVCKLYQDQWQPHLPCDWDSRVSDKMLCHGASWNQLHPPLNEGCRPLSCNIQDKLVCCLPLWRTPLPGFLRFNLQVKKGWINCLH